MDVEQKIKEDMRKLGCNSAMNISLAYQLYIHLVDEKLMHDTEYCYNSDIDTLYIVARRSKAEKLNIYVPFPTHKQVTLENINIIQENLCTIETGPTVNLAFVDGDFTTVIYSLTKGLMEKETPEQLAELRKREERRSFINNELKKNTNDILDDAFHGGFVDDDDCQVVD